MANLLGTTQPVGSQVRLSTEDDVLAVSIEAPGGALPPGLLPLGAANTVGTSTGIAILWALLTTANLAAAANIAITQIANGPANTFLAGGAPNTWQPALTAPANPGDTGRIVRVNAGDFTYIAGAANDVLVWNGAQWAGAQVADANVAVAAAILGTKIAPNFGAQNVSTTGNLSVGAATVAATGDIRLNGTGSVWGRAGASDVQLVAYNSGTTTLQLGEATGSANLTNLLVTANSLFGVRIGTLTRFQVQSTGANVIGNYIFDASVAAPVLLQTTAAGAAAVGIAMVLHSQDVSGAGATVGALLTVRGGDSVNGTGGGHDIRAGTGPTANGATRLLDGATQRMIVGPTGLGFFTHAQAAQPADLGAPAFVDPAAQAWCAALRTNVLQGLGLTA